MVLVVRENRWDKKEKKGSLESNGAFTRLKSTFDSSEAKKRP